MSNLNKAHVLSPRERDCVSGGESSIPYPYPKPEPEPVTPPFYVTQAIGEDGGDVPDDLS